MNFAHAPRVSALLMLTLVVVASACGSATDPAGAGGGNGTTGGGSGTTGGGSGTTGGGQGPDAPVAPNCSGFCTRATAAGCGDVSASCQSECQTLIDSSPQCADIQARFFNCVADLNQAQVQCDNGATVAPSCEPIAELTGVNGCASAVNKTDCYGATCKFDSDCGSVADFRCNTQTGRCIKTTTACRGLPCKFDSDCGDLTAWVCNSSLRVCVAK